MGRWPPAGRGLNSSLSRAAPNGTSVGPEGPWVPGPPRRGAALTPVQWGQAREHTLSFKVSVTLELTLLHVLSHTRTYSRPHSLTCSHSCMLMHTVLPHTPTHARSAQEGSAGKPAPRTVFPAMVPSWPSPTAEPQPRPPLPPPLGERVGEGRRSGERRVGKECRSRWSPYH